MESLYRTKGMDLNPDLFFLFVKHSEAIDKAIGESLCMPRVHYSVTLRRKPLSTYVDNRRGNDPVFADSIVSIGNGSTDDVD